MNFPAPRDNHEPDLTLAKTLFRAVLFVLISYILLLAARVYFAPMHPLGHYFAVATVVLLLITLLMAHFRIQVRAVAYFFITYLLVLVVARAFVAGGIASPVLIIGIVIPVTAFFLLGKMAGILFIGAIYVVILSFAYFRLHGVLPTETYLDETALGLVQGVVILFATSICTWVAWLYALNNEGLRQSLVAQTRIDHLTGIPNRRAFDHALELESRVARRQGQPLTLFMIDLDNFKHFNDLYGHHKGDECLIKVANMIQSCLRRPGDVVARFGGEEFAVILPDTPLTQAMQLAETMRQAVVGMDIKHEENEAAIVTITLGVCDLDLDGLNPESMLVRADKALYEGKTLGRNRVKVAKTTDSNPEPRTDT